MDTITDENRIAMCKACLVAANLKSCATCAFKIGLKHNKTQDSRILHDVKINEGTKILNVVLINN